MKSNQTHSGLNIDKAEFTQLVSDLSKTELLELVYQLHHENRNYSEKIFQHRKQAEIFNKSTKVYKSAFNESLIPRLILNRNGMILAINCKASAYFKKTSASLTGSNIRELIHQDSVNEINYFISSTNYFRESQLAISLNNGKAIVLQADSGKMKPGAFSFICKEITTDNSADVSWEGSQRFHRQLFEMLNGFAFCKIIYKNNQAIDFKYLLVNKAYEQLTGLTGVTGKRVSKLIPGIFETSPEVLETYARVARTGIPEHFEAYIDQLQLWFIISAYSPMPDHFVAVLDVINDRKAIESKLRQKENLYLSVINAMSEGVLLHNKDGFITECNEAACNLLHCTPKDLIGQKSLARNNNMFNENGTPVSTAERPALKALRTKQAVKNIILGLQLPDKDEFSWFNINAIPLVCSDKTECRFVVVTFTDITVQKLLKDQLKKANNQMDLILNVTRDSVLLMDAQLNLQLANKSALKWLNINIDTCTDKHISSILSKEYYSQILGYLQSTFNNSANYDFEDFSNGIWTTNHIYPIFDHEQKVKSIALFSRDITLKKEALDSLAESERKFKAIADYSASWEAWFDNNLDLLWMNPGCTKFTGYTPEEYMNSEDLISMLIPADEIETTRQHFF